ncbi:MAG: hypothetical protein U1F81_19360 [Verrucomicrobiaceae bacterium]
MNEAQRKMYGDTLLDDGTDPMFWAAEDALLHQRHQLLQLP